MIFMRKNILLMVLMIGASLLAIIFHPAHRIADEGPAVNLETMIPKKFSDWSEHPQQTAQIINPQQKETLERIYTQTLSRSYVNANGEIIMLTIAYGADQSDAKQLHYPEVCYPAQGFQVTSTQIGSLKTDLGDIKVKRLVTVLGARIEPLTYWATVGNAVVMGGKETKVEQLRYGFRGKVPDGLLFRVSSINSDTAGSFALQERFVQELLHSLSPEVRKRIAGLGA